MKSTSLFLVFILCSIFICCGKQASNTQHVDNNKDSALVNDTLMVEESDTTQNEGGKSLNDIRFADFDDNDWLDNEYIRSLRKHIDDYNSGKLRTKV